jgi:hypothetical protein
MRRREFIAGLGAAVAWPAAARAQQTDGMRRIGVLTQYPEGDPAAAANIKAFGQKMRDLGWTEDRNVAIEYRWTVVNGLPLIDFNVCSRQLRTLGKSRWGQKGPGNEPAAAGERGAAVGCMPLKRSPC